MNILKVLVLCVVVCILAGCSAFSPPALSLSVQKNGADQDTSVEMVTRYELEQGGEVYYNPETKELEVILNSATTDDSDSEMIGMMRLLLQTVLQQQGVVAAQPPTQ